MYFNDYSKWSELLNPKENEEVFNAKIDKLVKFLSEHQISGVIMRGLSLYVRSKIIMLLYFLCINATIIYFIQKLLSRFGEEKTLPAFNVFCVLYVKGKPAK